MPSLEGPQSCREAMGKKRSPESCQVTSRSVVIDPLGSPKCAFVSLQSPPKLNEVISDANRENSAVESGSESSSQEATPEKGMSQSYCLVGGGYQVMGHCPSAPWPGRDVGLTQHSSNNLMNQPLGQSQKAMGPGFQ